ncbi:MAG: T9SS type A sorting domain-containing protein [Bacteroidota bacterium]
MSQIDHLQIAPAKEMGKSLMISLESLRKEALLAGPFVSEERRLSRRTKFVVPKDTAVLVKKVEPPTYYQGPAFRIYPNPATDFVQLEVSDEALWGQPVIFVDRKGEVVLRTQTDSSGNLKQSLDSFKAGIYLVGIKKPTGWGFRQLVIQ